MILGLKRNFTVKHEPHYYEPINIQCTLLCQSSEPISLEHSLYKVKHEGNTHTPPSLDT